MPVPRACSVPEFAASEHQVASDRIGADCCSLAPAELTYTSYAPGIPPTPRPVDILAFPDAQLLDVAGPCRTGAPATDSRDVGVPGSIHCPQAHSRATRSRPEPIRRRTQIPPCSSIRPGAVRPHGASPTARASARTRRHRPCRSACSIRAHRAPSARWCNPRV